jgi:hypothetical protein
MGSIRNAGHVRWNARSFTLRGAHRRGKRFANRGWRLPPQSPRLTGK